MMPIETMPKRMLVTRIDKAEKAVMGTVRGSFSSDCNCFPEDEQPFFCSVKEEAIASKVKCPIHGNRFRQPIFHVYVPEWRRNSEPGRRQRLSAQYRKAWESSFG